MFCVIEYFNQDNKGKYLDKIRIREGGQLEINNCESLLNFQTGKSYIKPTPMWNPQYPLEWHDDEDIGESAEGFYRVVGMKWRGEKPFETYVANWMNNHNAEFYKSLLNGGIMGTCYTDLWKTHTAMKVLLQFKDDIEEIFERLQDGLGVEGCWGIFKKHGVSFNLLSVCAFEETLRDTLMLFDMEDV